MLSTKTKKNVKTMKTGKSKSNFVVLDDKNKHDIKSFPFKGGVLIG
jgi:hypothetical protein